MNLQQLLRQCLKQCDVHERPKQATQARRCDSPAPFRLVGRPLESPPSSFPEEETLGARVYELPGALG